MQKTDIPLPADPGRAVSPEPDLLFPFETPDHPDRAQVETQVLAWARASELAADDRELAIFAAGRFGELSAWTMPRASLRQAVLIGQVIAWLFAFDDRYLDQGDRPARPEEVAALLVRCQQLLRPTARWQPVGTTADPGQQRCLDVLADLLADLRSASDFAQVHRFEQELSYALYGALLEISWHAAHVPVRPEWYAVTRPMTSAALVLLTLIGVGTETSLSAEQWAAPDVQRLTMHAGAFIGWTNDLYSRHKEAGTRLNDTNLCWLLDQPDENGVLGEMRRICQDELDAYLRLEATVAAKADPALLSYMDGLRCCMHGNYQWTRRTPRYR